MDDINKELVLLEREKKMVSFETKKQLETFSKQLNEFIYQDIQNTLAPKKETKLKKIIRKIFTFF